MHNPGWERVEMKKEAVLKSSLPTHKHHPGWEGWGKKRKRPKTSAANPHASPRVGEGEKEKKGTSSNPHPVSDMTPWLL